jgi:hypothetical protein
MRTKKEEKITNRQPNALGRSQTYNIFMETAIPNYEAKSTMIHEDITSLGASWIISRRFEGSEDTL